TPLILSLTGFDINGQPNEIEGFSEELNNLLTQRKFRKIEDVANTIFPKILWQTCGSDRHKLYIRYLKVFESYKNYNPRENNRGSYFERLINYGNDVNRINQLEWIISQQNSRKGVRRSMLQASIFDPYKDHVATAQLQFPCMQHMSFEPTEEGLVVNAFYATQQLFIKAYGNYLGISQLGAFIAHEINMPLYKVNVFVGIAKLEKIPKNDVQLKNLVALAQLKN
ncbi:thymidylate synthase, partial [Acinetobacter baumannii]|uniref:thymidylate synthase n=2 Tax=Acinetobacter TaxID=469 RepID=UPI0004517A98